MGTKTKIGGILGIITAISAIFWGVTTKLWIEPRDFEIERLTKINEECNQLVITYKNFKEERAQLKNQIIELKAENENMKNNWINKEKYNELKYTLLDKTNLEKQINELEQTKLKDIELIKNLKKTILAYENQEIILTRIDSLKSIKYKLLSHIGECLQYIQEIKLEKINTAEEYVEEIDLDISSLEEAVIFFQKQVDELDEQIKILQNKL